MREIALYRKKTSKMARMKGRKEPLIIRVGGEWGEGEGLKVKVIEFLIFCFGAKQDLIPRENLTFGNCSSKFSH